MGVAAPFPPFFPGQIQCRSAEVVIADRRHAPVVNLQAELQPPSNELRLTTVTPPQRYRNSVVPHIYIDGADAAISFYKHAFGASEIFRIAKPDGRILHAELTICGSTLMLGDPDDELYGEPSTLGRCTAGLHLFVEDNASVMARAIQAGCEEIQTPVDMFYGANSASVRDPFGHVWVLLTWKEDLDVREIERRAKGAFSRE